MTTDTTETPKAAYRARNSIFDANLLIRWLGKRVIKNWGKNPSLS